MLRVRLFLTLAMYLLVFVSCSDDPTAPGPTPSSVAANGWPISHAPSGYVGTGYAIGDLLPEFVASDQFGNDDVRLTQFYGATVILQVGGSWCIFCNQADGHLSATMDSLNGLYENMSFWVLDVFDGQSGMDSTRAANHAATYGIDFPILFGPEIDLLPDSLGVVGFPTFFFLDPELRFRELHVGGGTSPANVISNARATADSFLVQNPDWESPFKTK